MKTVLSCTGREFLADKLQNVSLLEVINVEQKAEVPKILVNDIVVVVVVS